MAQQALIIENTIREMKRAMDRRDSASDSDTTITRHTNRGNKLKRKARFVRGGRLGQADGPQVHKKVRRVLYNGYSRHIISRNPPRVDQDGDVVDSENENSDLDTTDAEDDPYQSVRLENILVPLTAAADLDKHPSLSVPFTNQVLEQMVRNAQELVQREQAALWRIKNMQTQSCGDEPHAPVCKYQGDETMEELEERPYAGSADASVVDDTQKVAQLTANWDTMTNVRLVAGLENAAGGKKEPAPQTDGLSLIGNQPPRLSNEELENAVTDSLLPDHTSPGTETVASADKATGAQQDMTNRDDNGESIPPDTQADKMEASAHLPDNTVSEDGTNKSQVQVDTPNVQRGTEHSNDMDIDPSNEANDSAPSSSRFEDGARPSHPDAASNAQTQPDTPLAESISIQDHAVDDAAAEGASTASDAPRRTGTRAKTRAKVPDLKGQPTPPFSYSGGAPSPNSSAQHSAQTTQVHPFFIAPSQSLPHCTGDLVTPGLADEVRRQLSFYVQKQQEVTRQSNSLLAGLRRAQRLKNDVWDWCRNEAHVGEMSDGEDWIDVEKWDIAEGDLRKGEEVEDEDPAGMVVKKTRNRRAAG